MRRSHILSLLLVIAVAGASFIGVLSAGWKPVLGVQLQGGVEVVLRPADEVTDEQFETLFGFVNQKVESIVDASVDYQDSEILEEWEDLFDVHTVLETVDNWS